MIFELQEHTNETSGNFNAGDMIIEHVSNTSVDHPIFELPTILGVNFSVTKHVLMLWLVATFTFFVISWSTRKYLKKSRADESLKNAESKAFSSTTPEEQRAF